MSKECIIYGCTNKKEEGNFTGDICDACYEMLTEGKPWKPSNNMVANLYAQNQRLHKKINEVIMTLQE